MSLVIAARRHVAAPLAIWLGLLAGITPLDGFAQPRSVDWESCAGALDTLKDEAESAHSDAEEAAEEQDALQRCRSDPSGDSFGDKCQTRSSRFRSASNSARFAADGAISAAQEVQASCTPMSVQERLAASQARLCSLYRRHAAISVAQARATCEKAQGKQWCEACLK